MLGKKPTSDPGERLYLGILRRQEAALEELVKREARRITNVIYNWIQDHGSREDAEEAASDVFIIVWNRV